MSAPRLYRHLRENGIKTTLEEAEKLRKTWLETFTEMNDHFERTPITNDEFQRYGIKEEGDIAYEDEDPMADKKKGKKLYKTTTITGFIRNRATYNAACNTDFQNLVAHVAKEAMWNLFEAGFGPRFLNFIHDEIDYWLYPQEVRQLAPIVEKLWLAPSKLIFPDVKLKCETSLSLYWDKGGVEMSDVQWDDNGCPILEVPEFVKKAYEAKH